MTHPTVAPLPDVDDVRDMAEAIRAVFVGIEGATWETFEMVAYNGLRAIAVRRAALHGAPGPEPRDGDLPEQPEFIPIRGSELALKRGSITGAHRLVWDSEGGWRWEELVVAPVEGAPREPSTLGEFLDDVAAAARRFFQREQRAAPDTRQGEGAR